MSDGLAGRVDRNFGGVGIGLLAGARRRRNFWQLCLVCATGLALSACAKSSSTTPSTTSTTTVPAVPQFAGSWQGKWQHLACDSQNSGPVDRCNGIIIGDSSALSLTVTQSGTTVSGTLNYSGILLLVDGTVGSDGVLSLSSQRNGGRSVTDWKSTLSGSRLEGTFTFKDLSYPQEEGRVISDRLLDVLRVN